MEQQQKRILIFSTAYFPFVGGAEVALRELTDRLPQYEFEMITARMDHELLAKEQVGNVLVHRIGTGSRFDKLRLAFRGSALAHTLHKKNKYDVVWAMMASFGGFAAMFFKRRHKNVSYVLTLQEGDPISYIREKVRLIYPLFKQIFTRADSVTAISHYLAGWAKEEGFSGDALLVPNGVSISKFAPENSTKSREELRRDLGLKESDVALVTSSRLSTKNGLEYVIRALVHLPESVKFLIVGIGELETNLKHLTRELGLENRVSFLGWDGYDRLAEQLHASDIFIRPSLSEGQGISFLEAMAAELPVIATPVGGIPDFLEHKKTGLFCNVQDPESIAEQVVRFMEDTQLREAVVTSARKMVNEKYDWDTIAPQMGRVFERVLK